MRLVSSNMTTLKRWCGDEAEREHVTPHAIACRRLRGKYPWLVLKRVNKRVIYVELEKSFDWLGEGALTSGFNLDKP